MEPIWANIPDRAFSNDRARESGGQVTPRARVVPQLTRFAATTRTEEWDREDAELAEPEPWLHGQSACRECDFAMAVHAPAGGIEHGFCPACGAELRFMGLDVADLEATGTDR